MADLVSRALAAGVAWSTGLALALGPGLPAAAAAVKVGSCEAGHASASPAPERGDAAAAQLPALGDSAATGLTGDSRSGQGATNACAEESAKERGAGRASPVRLAQFQLPRRAPPSTSEEQVASPRYPYRPLVQHLKYEYAIGTESPMEYRRNSDLNGQVSDNVLIVTPQLNGLVIYRPTDWLVGTLELVLEKEYAVQAPAVITLPSGEQIFPKNQPTSLLVDQGFVTVKRVTEPFELHAGRRNYEDERHWLYDTSLDMGSVELKLRSFRVEATGGREALWDLDFGTNQVKDRIDTYMLYAEYRGIEDTKLAAYAIRRHDRTRGEGRKLNLGVRALGNPSDRFKYWVELGLLRGRDEESREFRGRALDIGATYTLKGYSFYPSFTVSYAYGSGDSNPDDNVNKEFRQTGMESNEEKWAGVAKFKYYGEALDPQLSNLKIFTVGFGFRPARSVTVDLVYHWYRLDAVAEEVPNSPITAIMNQNEARPSKDVGRGFDVVIGIRNVFGVRRLGIDLRAGWFYPGDAYQIAEGDPDDPTFRRADKGVGVVAKLWY